MPKENNINEEANLDGSLQYTLELPAVIDGEIIPIEEVEDQIFSSKLIAKRERKAPAVLSVLFLILLALALSVSTGLENLVAIF